jgi:hypothetical protein
VRNNSPDRIPNLFVIFQWENENPQPHPDGTRTASGGTPLAPMTRFKGTLEKDQEQIFCLDEKYQQEQVLGRVAALSPERYWVSIFSGGQEIHCVDGSLVGAVLEGLQR